VPRNCAGKALECTLLSEQHGARILNFTGLATTLPSFSAVANTFAPCLPSTEHARHHRAQAGKNQSPATSALIDKTFRYERRSRHYPHQTDLTPLTPSRPSIRQAASHRSKRAVARTTALSTPTFAWLALSAVQAADQANDHLFARAYAGIYRCTPLDALDWHNDFAHAIYQRKIWLNDHTLYYHSDGATSTMSPLRQYAGAIIDFFLEEIIASEQKLDLKSAPYERGLAVALENEVLRQTGDTSPPRICFALTSNPQSYLHHQSAVIRTANSENDFLHQYVLGGPSEIPIHEDEDILGLSDITSLGKPAPDIRTSMPRL
jgi:hypothetical protein